MREMNSKLFFSGLIIPVFILLVPNVSNALAPSVFAITDDPYDAFRNITEEEREIWFNNDRERPAINPDFAPDEDCNIAYEIKCIPGSEQDCPEGYHNGEDNVCSPVECQEDYHGRDDDETGLCYPDSEGCEWDNYVMLEREDGERNTCKALYYICDNDEHKEEEYCIEFCEEDPTRFGCARTGTETD